MTPLVVERAAKCERNSNELVNVDSDVLEKQSRSRMIIVTDVVVMRQQCLQLHTINHVAVGGGMYCDATACRTTHPHPWIHYRRPAAAAAAGCAAQSVSAAGDARCTTLYSNAIDVSSRARDVETCIDHSTPSCIQYVSHWLPILTTHWPVVNKLWPTNLHGTSSSAVTECKLHV